jgi:transposase
VRGTKVWKSMIGRSRAVDFDDDAEEVVVRVRPGPPAKRRCGQCQRPASRYDGGHRRRRWRALDLGTVKVWLEADLPRVACAEHGVVVAAVPWARHDAGHTFAFDDNVALPAVQTSKTAVLQLMRIAWRVGRHAH